MRILPLHACEAAERDRLCRRFHAEVAQTAFPMAAELETADAWLERMAAPGAGHQPILHMHVALDETGGGVAAIAGGLLVEIYPASRCVLITYIAVAPAYRGQRLASALLQAGRGALTAAGYGDCPILAEAEDPERVDESAENAGLAPHARLRILAALGFDQLDFAYVQPALAPDKAPVGWLFLLALRDSLPQGRMPAAALDAFLVEFFSSLDHHADNVRHLATMREHLAAAYLRPGQNRGQDRDRGNGPALLPLPKFAGGAFRPIVTPLPGRRAAILLTFLIRCREAGKPPAGFLLRELRQRLDGSPDAAVQAAQRALVEPVASFADDIVAPAFRADTMPLLFLAQPFGQHELGQSHAGPVLEVSWPQALHYQAEGRRKPVPGFDPALHGTAMLEPLRLRWHDSFALFGSGHLAYSVALHAAPDSPRAMNEIDLLLLQKFVDQTEDVVHVVDAAGAEPLPLTKLNCFSLDGVAPGTLLDCVRNRVMGLHTSECGAPLRRLMDCAEMPLESWEPRDWDYGNLCGGVVQIDRIEPLPVAAEWSGEQAKALAGLTQNILDFQDQDEAELRDSLQPQFEDPNWLQVYGHSRLIHEFSYKSRSLKRMRHRLGLCPYLMLTHLVLTYDERLLTEAETLFSDIVYGRRLSLRVRPLAPLFSLLEQASKPASRQFAESLQSRLAIFRELEFPYIENVFRYRTEQRIYTGLDKMRGLTQRRERFRTVLNQYKEAVSDVHDYTDLTSQRRIGVILLGLSLLSVLGFLKDIPQIFLLPEDWIRQASATWLLRGVSGIAFMLFLGIVGWGLWLLLRKSGKGKDRG